jgi:hypothetical protein
MPDVTVSGANMSFLIGAVLTLMGAVLIMFSIVTARSLQVFIPFVPEGSRAKAKRFLELHRGLILQFLLGYLVVTGAFIFRIYFLGEIIIAIVFLLGSLYVAAGLRLQSRMLHEIRSGNPELLPICVSCKKIRQPESDPHNRESWQAVERYISARTRVDFTHGFCPDCLKRLYPDLID